MEGEGGRREADVTILDALLRRIWIGLESLGGRALAFQFTSLPRSRVYPQRA